MRSELIEYKKDNLERELRNFNGKLKNAKRSNRKISKCHAPIIFNHFHPIFPKFFHNKNLAPTFSSPNYNFAPLPLHFSYHRLLDNVHFFIIFIFILISYIIVFRNSDLLYLTTLQQNLKF